MIHILHYIKYDSRRDLTLHFIYFHSLLSTPTVTRSACADFTKIMAYVSQSLANKLRFFFFSLGWTRGQNAARLTDGTVNDVNALEKFTTMNELWTELDAYYYD